MNAWVYLVKATNSGGLHKIGKTENIERRMKELRVLPVDRICVIELPSVDVMDSTEKHLHHTFKAFRIPQSEMFNLSTEHLESCKKSMVAIEKRFAMPPPLTEEQKLAKATKEIEATHRRREELRRQELADAVEKRRKAHVQRIEEDARATQNKLKLDGFMTGLASKRHESEKLDIRQRKTNPSDFLFDFSIFSLTTCSLAITGIPLTPVLIGGLFAVVLYRVVRWVRS